MEHQYLRSQLDRTIGLNTTRAKSICCLNNGELILTAQANKVGAFNNTLSKILKTYDPPKSFDDQDETIQVVDLAVSNNNDFIAVGYSNGEIVVFNQEGEILNHFVGHRRQISCLQFNSDSSLLASGSFDNDVIIWDISADNGVCRLIGHQNAITDLCFIPETKWLISSSKDTHIRVWDIELQTCIQTVTTTASEIWTLCYIAVHRQVLCAGRSTEFYIFSVAEAEDFDSANPVVLTLHYQIARKIPHRAQSIITNKDNSLIAISSSGKSIEIWKIYDPDKIQQKIKRKKRRSKEKAKAKGETEVDDNENQNETEEAQQTEEVITAASEFEHLLTYPFDSKICAHTFSNDFLIASLANNTIQKLKKKKLEKEEKDKKEDNSKKEEFLYELANQTQGHSSDIRCIEITGEHIISSGNGECRVWDIESGSCVSHIECDYARSMIVLPGGRFVVIGTNTGKLQLIDISDATKYLDIEAHSKSIWSIAMTKDASEIATGSEDHEVRFWVIQFDEMERPVLVHKRTLKLNDEVFAVRYNADSSLIACALIDTTVRIFYTDTLNFHQSLYGAQLPVTSIDYSTDNSLIVTSSADKNLRIFGTEFGDCHRSLWAHQSPVVCVRFVPATHLAWTIGRDGNLTLWDCDRFLNVQTLRSHIAEIWALAVSEHGQFVVTGGRDKGLRIWQRTTDPLLISIERENERERRMERDGADRVDRTVAALRGSVLGGAVIDTAARQSVESIAHGDILADAIQAADDDKILLKDCTPSQYVLLMLQKINRANIDVVMSSLPFHSAVSLIKWMIIWLREGKETELTVRCLCSLIKFHRTQFESSTEMRPFFLEAKEIIHEKVKQLKGRCGMNLAALKLISREMKNH